MNSRPAAIAVVAAIVALVFWGGTAVANRYAVGFIDPVTVATLRTCLAGIVALVIALALRMPLPTTRRDRFLLFLVGLVGFALWPLVISIALAKTTASHAALILATMPVMTVLVASIVHRTVPPTAWWLGGAAALLKSGLLARFWKPIAVALAALGAGVKRLFFSGRSSKHDMDKPIG